MHSKVLEDTALWQNYQKKIPRESGRGVWTEKIYNASKEYLKDVRLVFRNYTLHDETHILNVMDAMAGLLGDQITRLTVGELELLILSACMHDLGMVYSPEEIQQCLEDERGCRAFLREHIPELTGCSPQKWSEETKQWYLRTLHPFRLPDVLENAAWKELFRQYPSDAVPKRCVLAVCEAHGQEPRELKNNPELEYLPAGDTDPLFCALLLRLGDLLDFDDTRTPEVLYRYTAASPKSREEWDKHRASAGFCYPTSPSGDDLPYRARCTSPEVEHAVRDFLDWIDAELAVCARLQRYCNADWQRRFPFPRAVWRGEIKSDGYMSGDFRLTMDQEQILNLLTGENLYDSRDVFVRELLQNAIDAVLLRGEMEPGFSPENSRIDFWEWIDTEGNIWFRVDDRGTGMTLGMLQRYFLRVGNSYYVSKELERDLRDHGQLEDFCGISRFGIGFLSCFLCCDAAEVSTLYFNQEKNEREAPEMPKNARYGLRLAVTGLSGYYTLKNQAGRHETDGDMPGPDISGAGERERLEQNGYRAVPGTSIALKMDPGKLGTLNLRETLEKYLCCARVPVYYNNRRVGMTCGEFMKAAHEAEGETVYELTPEMKEQFDKCFPAVRGQYPKVTATVIPLDTETAEILPGLSGVVVKYNAYFEKTPEWSVKDQTYTISINVTDFDIKPSGLVVSFSGQNECDVPFSPKERKGFPFSPKERKGFPFYTEEWEELEKAYGLSETDSLRSVFETYDACPKSEKELGDAWLPFSGKIRLEQAWRAYCDIGQCTRTGFSFSKDAFSHIRLLTSIKQDRKMVCAYEGVMAVSFGENQFPGYTCYSTLLLSGAGCRPVVEVSRSGRIKLPLNVLVAIHGIYAKHKADGIYWANAGNIGDVYDYLLKDWRQVRISRADDWLCKCGEHWFASIRQELQRPLEASRMTRLSISGHNPAIEEISYFYLISCFQDNERMTVDYENGQIISFFPKEETEKEDLSDLFPPMMFCMAASDESRQYICSAKSDERRAITADHPFTAWLMENAVLLDRYYPRQFGQITESLRKDDAETVIRICSEIREQFLSLPVRHGVDVYSMPKLCMDDFWIWHTEKIQSREDFFPARCIVRYSATQ